MTWSCSTARAESSDPEDVRALLRVYHERAREELESFGGTVEKFIGDAVVAVFGAPIAHEDDPERAVRGALAVRDAVARLNEDEPGRDLHVRVAGKDILKGLTLEVQPGQVHAIMGPNGAGKSTLGNVIAGREGYARLDAATGRPVSEGAT